MNFYIQPIDDGYEVLDSEKRVLGTAETWEQATNLIPNGAHEMLIPMHGVRLNSEMCKEVLKNGFYSWGSGII